MIVRYSSGYTILIKITIIRLKTYIDYLDVKEVEYWVTLRSRVHVYINMDMIMTQIDVPSIFGKLLVFYHE